MNESNPPLWPFPAAGQTGGCRNPSFHKDQPYGFFNYRHAEYDTGTVRKIDRFLVSLHNLQTQGLRRALLFQTIQSS